MDLRASSTEVTTSAARHPIVGFRNSRACGQQEVRVKRVVIGNEGSEGGDHTFPRPMLLRSGRPLKRWWKLRMTRGDYGSPLCMKDRWTIVDGLWMIDCGPFPVAERFVEFWQQALAVELYVDIVPGLEEA